MIQRSEGKIGSDGLTEEDKEKLNELLEQNKEHKGPNTKLFQPERRERGEYDDDETVCPECDVIIKGAAIRDTSTGEIKHKRCVMG